MEYRILGPLEVVEGGEPVLLGRPVPRLALSWGQGAGGLALKFAPAQQRLHRRYARFAARGKSKQHIVTAVARELTGFVWAALTQ